METGPATCRQSTRPVKRKRPARLELVMNLRRVVLLLLCFVVVLSLNALADDPSGRVARLNYISGQVSLQPGGVNDWVAGNINRPLTTADRVWTDRDARAEVQMGAASARLNV